MVIIRPSNRRLVVLWVLLGAALIVCSIATVREPRMWKSTIVPLAVGVMMTFWVKSFKIQINTESLIYTAPFSRRREVKFAEITDARIEVGVQSYRDRFRPMARLVISRGGGANRESFDIHYRIFPAPEIRELFRLLAERGFLRADSALL